MSSNCGLLQCLLDYFPALPAAGWVIRPLTGLTQGSVSIEQAGIRLIGRAPVAHSAGPGVSRRKEARILSGLRHSGLSPHVAGYSHGWLLLHRVEGDTLAPDRMASADFMPPLATLISRLHTGPLTGYRLALKAQVQHHYQQMDKRRLTPRWRAVHRAFMHLPEPHPLKLAPAHMDIHPGNLIMSGNKLSLIDWEYAADTDIGLSLAALFRANNWSLTLINTFLRYYSGYHCPQRVLLQTRRWQRRTDYMMLMWFEGRWGHTGDPQFLQYSAPLMTALGIR